MSGLIIEQVIANGDCAVLIRFAASKQRLIDIHSLSQNLIQKPLPSMINVIPATNNITLVFSHKVKIDLRLVAELQNRCASLEIKQLSHQIHEIPVCYHPEVAADVIRVCEQLNVDLDQLVVWHTQATYRVAMLGFLPGFTYLNGNHEKIRIPRKANPVLKVSAGSVAVAGKQTGIYALASPGGWQVIGQTAMSILDWQNTQQPMRLSPLDEVRFKAISLSAYYAQGGNT